MSRLANRIDHDTILLNETYDAEFTQNMEYTLEDIRHTLRQNADELAAVAYILEQALELPRKKEGKRKTKKSEHPICSMEELAEYHCEFGYRVEMASEILKSITMDPEYLAFSLEHIQAFDDCGEMIDKVKAYNEVSIERISAIIAQTNEHKAKANPIPNGADLPQSDLDILLSGMRDYQEDSGNPFVFNRIMLGMIETPLYFAVDMEHYKGNGKPDIGYIMNNVRRFPMLGNLIVALVRNEDLPSEGTTVKPIPLYLEEYIPALAEKKEPLLLLDPVEGNPVVIPSEAIGGLLLTCAKEKLGE